VDEAAGPRPFRERVARFARALDEAGPAIQSAFERGEAELVAPRIQAIVDELIPGLAWTLCPGRDEQGLGLALSPEGDRHRRLLTGWVAERHPELGGLDLFPAKPANPSADSWILGLDDHELRAEQFRVDAQIDAAHGAVDVRLHHPVFADCDERTRAWAAFLWLDEALGEDLVMRGVGTIETTDEAAGPDAVDGRQLRARVRALVQEAGGDPDLPPAGSFSMVRIPEGTARDGAFRADARFGTTRFVPLLSLWIDEEAADPLAPLGAGYAALGFPLDRLEEGRAADQRGEIEDAIDEALQAAAAGCVLGGLFGPRLAYVDLLTLCPEAAENAVRAALAACARVASAELAFLARRDGRIVVK
jgi:hypothetical protein